MRQHPNIIYVFSAGVFILFFIATTNLCIILSLKFLYSPPIPIGSSISWKCEVFFLWDNLENVYVPNYMFFLN